ncbi:MULTISPECIES: bifunctional 2-polyprenyl-6-hydroxyphenol methylase/3-demethylubiquinol 3-O-methyltransferase UbiG [Ignavibacterium]|jgi:SAM-dependent methyltransferase|uniref:class I SAM-dependent methyltransferase n=1 Tax=Ignavibacterium TaxID=795750 RepID=UPI0025B8E155|nr:MULTISPECIES: class I SAM-dependent methyltransferase [Ignavibacterium]MBI5660679.1 methyltransferase domain-containing protein [Ignavibacterium album]
MSNQAWDERYSTEEYIYGTEPNEFFKQQLDLMKPGKLLLPGEGEGRNAVYAASNGWLVDAVDFSNVAKEKALKLAESKSVKINYFVSDLLEFHYPVNYYDLAGLFFVHLPKDAGRIVHSKIIASLKSGGKIIFEAFNKMQINNNSGGPKDINLLYDEKDILESFRYLEILMIESLSTELYEGNFHRGKADVIRFVGRKK